MHHLIERVEVSNGSGTRRILQSRESSKCKSRQKTIYRHVPGILEVVYGSEPTTLVHSMWVELHVFVAGR